MCYIYYKYNKMIIYLIKNLINEKVYIGQTIQTLKKRIASHYRHPNKHLSNAFNKYGKNNFIIEIIETCNNLEELNEREKYWIKFYDSTNNKKGYNIDGGGRKNIIRIKKTKNSSKIKGRPKVSVQQLDAKTYKIIKTYSSISEAAKELLTHESYITAACQLRQAYSLGFIWKYTNIDFETWIQTFEEFLKKRKGGIYRKPILNSHYKIKQLNLNDELIKIWDYEEFKTLPKQKQQAINACCSHGYSSYGYKWIKIYISSKSGQKN